MFDLDAVSVIIRTSFASECLTAGLVIVKKALLLTNIYF